MDSNDGLHPSLLYAALAGLNGHSCKASPERAQYMGEAVKPPAKGAKRPCRFRAIALENMQ